MVLLAPAPPLELLTTAPLWIACSRAEWIASSGFITSSAAARLCLTASCDDIDYKDKGRNKDVRGGEKEKVPR